MFWEAPCFHQPVKKSKQTIGTPPVGPVVTDIRMEVMEMITVETIRKETTEMIMERSTSAADGVPQRNQWVLPI